MARGILIVLTNPVDDEREDEFNDWYTNIHLRDVVKIPGIAAATRYKIAERQLNGVRPQHRYLAIYEVDDIDAAVDGLERAADGEEMYISDALDRTSAIAHFFLPITARVTAGVHPSSEH